MGEYWPSPVTVTVQEPRDVISAEAGLKALCFTHGGNYTNVEHLSVAELRQARDVIDAALSEAGE